MAEVSEAGEMSLDYLIERKHDDMIFRICVTIKAFPLLSALEDREWLTEKDIDVLKYADEIDVLFRNACSRPWLGQSHSLIPFKIFSEVVSHLTFPIICSCSVEVERNGRTWRYSP